MPGSCQHCGAQLAVGAVACFRCGRLVATSRDPSTGAGVDEPGGVTALSTLAKAEVLESQWRLVKLVGQGAVAQVWQAMDITLDRPVAVKLMHETVAKNPARAARFEEAGRQAASIEHANLLPVLGMGRLGARPFWVTPLLEGKTLAEALHASGGRLAPSAAAAVLAPICDALDCLHAAGLVHGDLKPSNVFLRTDLRVTLMGLGSAFMPGSDATQTGEILASPGYLSPEQISGKTALDGKSDVYALG